MGAAGIEAAGLVTMGCDGASGEELTPGFAATPFNGAGEAAAAPSGAGADASWLARKEAGAGVAMLGETDSVAGLISATAFIGGAMTVTVARAGTGREVEESSGAATAG